MQLITMENNMFGVPPEDAVASNASTAVNQSITVVVNPTSTVTFVESEEEIQKKRAAFAGQWRTPPTPFFPSGGGGGMSSTTTAIPLNQITQGSTSLPTMSTTTTMMMNDVVVDDTGIATSPPPPCMALPHSTEDYAKALQEAYRRGAEAAARAAAVQQQMIATSSSSSCPDLAVSTNSNNNHTASVATVPPSSMSAPPSTSSTTATADIPVVPSSSSSMTTDTANTLTTTLKSDQQQPHASSSMQYQVVHHHHHHHILPAPPAGSHNNGGGGTAAAATSNISTNGTTNTTTDPLTMITTTKPSPATSEGHRINPIHRNAATPIMMPVVSLLPPPPPPATLLHQPSTDLTMMGGIGTATRVVTETKQQQQQRSVSLPDMSSYAAQQEEEKRQKRLARNRASARLRRLRKKNLVDAYEVEVGHLEKTMSLLQQHEWGCTNNSHTTGVQSATVLAEALSMDRGQQKLTVAERQTAATDILQQQLQFVQQLEDLMQEQYVLQQVADLTLNGCSSSSSSDHEWKDLQETLQLSPEQCQQIVDQSTGWDNEWQALQTVKSSLIAMRDNDWLWNEGCAGITDQFMSILHSNQISKLLLWADHNAETIEELDSVHAINVVPDTPTFQFGMDSNPNEYLDDERMAT